MKPLRSRASRSLSWLQPDPIGTGQSLAIRTDASVSPIVGKHQNNSCSRFFGLDFELFANATSASLRSQGEFDRSEVPTSMSGLSLLSARSTKLSFASSATAFNDLSERKRFQTACGLIPNARAVLNCLCDVFRPRQFHHVPAQDRYSDCVSDA